MDPYLNILSHILMLLSIFPLKVGWAGVGVGGVGDGITLGN